MTPSRSARLLATALALWLVAGAAYGGLRLVFGTRPVFVHVRWSSALDTADRERLEERYRLRPIELEEGSTFSYALTDTRTDNVRNLVQDPSVEDTHNIHRTAFRAGYFAPRLSYATQYPAVPVALEIAAGLSFFLGLASLCLALFSRVAPGLIQGPVLRTTNAFLYPGRAWQRTTDAIAASITRAIPAASAAAVAIFRIVFGGLLLTLVLRRPVVAAMAADPSNELATTHEFLLQLFVAAPWITDWLPAWTLLWGILFIAGAFARTSFACLTIGVLGWATLYTTATSYHTVCSLLLTLLALQGVPWGDAWSVDAWRRGSSQAVHATSKQYGYVTWAPALVLGLSFFAAAVAKIRDTGLAWILNGTVKYHFLSDSPSALVDWGLQVGHHPGIAVALSFGAIAIESLVLVGVLAGAYRYRLLAGLASLSLLLGFLLFQGLYWPGWWILLIAFLPWHLVRGHAELARDTSPQPRLAILLVVALFAQQIVVSTLRLEASPVFSTYDMYSTTYASPADYERNAGHVYWVVGVDRTGKTHRCRITSADAGVAQKEDRTAGARSLTRALARNCFDDSVQVSQVVVEATRVQVDWENWRLLDEPVRTLIAGPVHLDPGP